MIKIENDIFYISAGEACYIFRIENGVPMHVYFGKRVEPEDDLSALGFSGKTPELTVPTVFDGVKNIATDFVFATAGVNDDGDGKTLIVELIDKKNKLKAHMYYTPHPRGGIYRSVVFERHGTKTVYLPHVRQMVGCLSGSVLDDKDIKRARGFFAAVGSDGRGDACGFLCVNSDGCFAAKRSDDVVVMCCNGDAVTLGDGAASCPELLCVYSDNGKGGVSRIFHDILREDKNDGDLSERSAVLFLPKTENVDTLKSAVKAAGELGFGIVALDGGENTAESLRELGALCRANDLIPGLRIRRDFVENGSALYTESCEESWKGAYEYSSDELAALYGAVRNVVAQNGIRYVMIDERIDMPDDYMDYDQCDIDCKITLKNMIAEEFDGVCVDFGMRSEERSRALTACYPLMCVRNVISPTTENFKTRFDLASLGKLGYELDPLELSEGLKRAVRAQILSYQDDALTVLHGDIYSSENCRMAVSKDKSRAYAVCKADGSCRVKLNGLDEHNLYHVHELEKTFSGAALVNCGILLENAGTYVFHIRQVADY